MHAIILLGLTIPTVALNVHWSATDFKTGPNTSSVRTGSNRSHVRTGSKAAEPTYGLGCYPSTAQRASSTWDWTPTTQSTSKYYFIIPNRAGMNAQLIKMYEDIASAKVLGRTIVLPMLEDHKVLREHSRGYHHFGEYYDLDYMNSLNIKFIRPQDGVNILCAGEVFFNGSIDNKRLQRMYHARFSLNFTIMTDPASDINTKTCIAQYRPNTGFPAYSDYGTYGQGYSLAWGQTNEFAKAWYTVTPSPNVMAAADEVLLELPSAYNAVHLRRGDFRLLCGKKFMKTFINEFGMDACYQNETLIRSRILNFTDSTLPIYVATDDVVSAVRLMGHDLMMAPRHERDSRIGFIYGDQKQKIMFYEYHNVSQSDLTAVIDQVVCANANEFIGNRFSSFTTAINNMRLECNPSATLEFWQ